MSTLIAASLGACPDCPPVRDARAMLFENDLLLNLSFTLAPFALTLGVIGCLVRALQRRAARGARDA